MIGNGEPSRVVLENCAFEGNSASVQIKEYSQVLLINTTFTNCATGVDLSTGASAVLKHCRFVDTKNSVVARAKDCNIDVVNCSFVNCSTGILMSGGGNVNISGCLFDGCTQTLRVPSA